MQCDSDISSIVHFANLASILVSSCNFKWERAREEEWTSEGLLIVYFIEDTNKYYQFMEEHIVISLYLMVNTLYYIYLTYVNPTGWA